MSEELKVIATVSADTSQATSSLNSLTAEADKAKKALADMTAKFGEGSEEAKQAAAEVAKINAQLQQTKAATSNISNPIDDLNAKLKLANITLYATVAHFGDLSPEAQAAAAEVEKINSQLKQAKNNSEGIDQPIKSWKSQLKDAKLELEQMVDRFGELSPQVAVASDKVANLEDKIGDAKGLVDAFNPDAKFKGLGNAIQGATGALTAITGAQALFGTESKAVQETLLKVQGAMAFSQGINSVLESKDAFKALGAQILSLFAVKKADVAATQTQIVAQEGLATAQVATAGASKALKAALVSTGIGALVVGVGLLISAMMTWQDSTKEQEEAQKKLNDELERQKQLLQGSLEDIDFVTKAKVLQAKLAGKSEEEIATIEKEGRGERLDALKNNYLKAQELTDKAAKNSKLSAEEFAKIKANEANASKEYIKAQGENQLADLQGQVNVNDKKNKDAKDSADKRKQINEQALKDDEDLRNKRAEFDKGTEDISFENSLAQIKDEFEKKRQETKRAFNLEEDDLKKKLATKEIDQTRYDARLKELQIKFNNDIAQIDADAEEKRREREKENAEQRIENAKEIKDLADKIRIDGIKDSGEKEREQIKLNEQNALDAEKEKFQKGQTNLTEYLVTLSLIRKKFAKEKNDFEDKDAADKALKDFNANVNKLDKEIKDSDLSFNQRRAAVDKELAALDAYYKGKVGLEEEYNEKVKGLKETRKSLDLEELEEKQARQQEVFKLFQDGAQLFSAILDFQTEKINQRQKRDAKVQKDLLDGNKISKEEYEKNINKINEEAEKKRIKIQRKQIITEKVMAVAGIIMNTLQANAKAAVLYPPSGLPFTVYNTIAGALGVATTIAQAAKALSGLGGGGDAGGGDSGALSSSSGGGGTPTAAPIAPQADQTALPQDQINQLASANAATRAYVVESDVTNNQERITRLNRAARIN